MSNVSNLGDAYNWSVARIAEAFGLNRATVKKRLMDARIPVAGTVKNNPVYSLRDVGPALFSKEPHSENGDIHNPNLMDPKSRKDWFQSENERVKLEATLRNLVPAEDVHREMAMMAKAILQVMDTWPDRLERDRGWLPEQLAEAQYVIDEIRDVLAVEVSEQNEGESE